MSLSAQAHWQGDVKRASGPSEEILALARESQNAIVKLFPLAFLSLSHWRVWTLWKNIQHTL